MASVMQAQPAVNPIAEVLAGFGAHRSRIDHAFIRFNVPERELAMLVEVTMRRRQRRRVVEVCASLHTPSGASVYRASYPRSAIHTEPTGALSIGNLWLGAEGSRGVVGHISWDLVFRAAGPLVEPHVVSGLLRPFDLRLRSVPDALVSGDLSVSGHRYSFSQEPGTISAFHGRRHPDRWQWISANAFDQPGISIECMMLDSTIFGLPFLRARVGYFHLRTPSSTLTLMHPLTGHVRIEGERHQLSIAAHSRQGPEISVRCSVPATSFAHLGEGIYAALLGDCIIDGIAQATRTTGIVERVPQQ